MTTHYVSCASPEAHIGVAFIQAEDAFSAAKQIKELFLPKLDELKVAGNKQIFDAEAESLSDDVIIDPKFIGRILTVEEAKEALGDNGTVLSKEDCAAMDFKSIFNEASDAYLLDHDAKKFRVELMKVTAALKIVAEFEFHTLGADSERVRETHFVLFSHEAAIKEGDAHAFRAGRTYWTPEDVDAASEEFDRLLEGSKNAVI